MKDFRILLVDDEPAQITSIRAFLKRRGYKVATAGCAEDALAVIKTEQVDMVLTDFRMPGLSGRDLLIEIKKLNPEIPVVLMTAYGQIEDAVNVLKDGAFDYLTKPVDLNELKRLVEKARKLNCMISENDLLKKELTQQTNFNAIISQSQEMEQVLNIAARVAASKASVLIRGESGTGKELIARAVHLASARNDKPMVVVNCAALSDNLLESELFGHEKGSFTGANSQHIGRFEQANGGTLFIDEVGDIPLHTQVKLLRALQSGEFERVGGSQTIKVDVRVVTATNRNLEEMIRENQFREDLFYRLNVVAITIPALRNRKSDIPTLIEHFIKKYSEQNGKQITNLSREAQNQLMRYHFPGNVRELENMVERAVVLARDEIIMSEDLPAVLKESDDQTLLNPSIFTNDYSTKVAAFETAMIESSLKLTHGNQSQAAKILGITERHLRSRMQKLEIENTQKLRLAV